MRNVPVRKTLIALFLGASLIIPGVAMALTAKQTVLKEVEIKQADGTTKLVAQPSTLMVPGERIIYRLDIDNDGVEPADNLVLTMPVPKEISFIEGSAYKQHAYITYSADGGESFAARNNLLVIGTDGRSRLAIAEDITHIRWKLNQTLPAGAKDSISFKGLLK